MKDMPDIGSKVRYKEGRRSCDGTVTKQYPGGWEVYDNETGEKYIQPDYVELEVDIKPTWWYRPDTRLMCAETCYIYEI